MCLSGLFGKHGGPPQVFHVQYCTLEGGNFQVHHQYTGTRYTLRASCAKLQARMCRRIYWGLEIL